MKPCYWIGILAIVGSIIGTVIGFIFPEVSRFGASAGTVIGVATGTSIYAHILDQSKKKED